MTPADHKDVLCDFEHWKSIADHMATDGQAYNVIRNNRGEYLVFPATVECKGLSEIIYTAGGSDNAKTSD